MSKKLLDHFQSTQLSIEERFASGKKLRDKFPRIKQGEYKPAANRVDPISILEEQGKTRIPDLVPVRYARMLGSPFAFLRGVQQLWQLIWQPIAKLQELMCRLVVICILQTLVYLLRLNAILFLE